MSDAIKEASGIAASRRVDNVWWVHNDSGDTARVFAIGTTGQTLGEYSLTGASAIDWEDIAAAPGPTAGVSYLYVGDIGGNVTPRSSVQVYRVPEPLVNPASPLSTPQALSDVATLTPDLGEPGHDQARGLLIRDVPMLQGYVRPGKRAALADGAQAAHDLIPHHLTGQLGCAVLCLAHDVAVHVEPVAIAVVEQVR